MRSAPGADFVVSEFRKRNPARSRLIKVRSQSAFGSCLFKCPFLPSVLEKRGESVLYDVDYLPLASGNGW
jgi:hypothetical protein